MDATGPERVFRPHRLLVVGMGLGFALWASAFGWLLRWDGVPLKTLASAVFLCAFFAAGAVFYGRAAIFVDPLGLTYRGLWVRRRLAWGDILKVQVVGGPLTVYAIHARQGFVHFTSLYGRHRELLELLAERSDSARRSLFPD